MASIFWGLFASEPAMTRTGDKRLGLEQMPDEVLMNVVGHLTAIDDLRILQLVCRRFRDLARDRQVWRQLCFESSIAGQRQNRATIPKTIPPPSVQALQAEVQGLHALQSVQENIIQTRVHAKARELAKWDPVCEGDSTDWFREYVARQAPASLRWAKDTRNTVIEDVEGAALHKSSGNKNAVLRFEDGSVGIWNIGNSENLPGRVIRSRQGLLQGGYSDSYDGIVEDRAALASSSITECVSIDKSCNKAYIALECQLNEVDLNTLQLSNSISLPRPISALSNSSSGCPLILGTSTGLYRYDPRHSSRWFSGDQVLQHQQSLQQPQRAPGPQLPLSIIQAGHSSFKLEASEIYAAGRYPSVLIYDQRSFPKVRHSIWSGATFSSLSLLPGTIPQIPVSDSLSNLSDAQKGHTILAAGAKNGKGSLEMYAIDRSTTQDVGNIRNRTMASRSKLLSIAPHGRRVCVSDGDGNIKWFERDGFSLVRQININELAEMWRSSSRSSSTSPSPSPNQSFGNGANGGGLFGRRQDNGDVVQKLMPVGKEENSDLLVWAGSRAALVSLGTERFQDDGYDDEPEQVDEQTKRAQEYEAHMRRLLEVQAVEARRMHDFGM